MKFKTFTELSINNQEQDEDYSVSEDTNDGQNQSDTNTDNNSSEDDDYSVPDDTDDDQEKNDNDESSDDNNQDDDANTDDDNSSEDEDYTVSDDTDSDQDQDDDTNADDDESSENTDNDQVDDEYKQLEDQLYDTLTEKQKNIRRLELQKNFYDIYNQMDPIINSLESIEKKSDNCYIIDRLKNVSKNVKKYILDYLTNSFNNNTYIDNNTTYLKYIVLLNEINKVMKSLT